MEALRQWLGLQHALGGTPRTLHRLLKHCGEPELILKNLDQLKLTDTQKQRLRTINWAAIDKELKWSELADHHLITLIDTRYPSNLKEIHDPPAVLYIKGSITHLNQNQIAIVGSRNPSINGREIAERFAYELSLEDLIVTSGMAIGIDGCAHSGALRAKKPTIAVLGCGVEVVYPKRHRQLAKDIVSNGAIISEYPIYTQPHASHFPQRNRIISGLSLGTLVIEATLKSGSLITANLANDQGREVMAVPGSIYNPQSRGCFELINNGASLVSSSANILEILQFNSQYQTHTKRHSSIKALDKTDRLLLECLGFEARTVQYLINSSGFSTQIVSSRLLYLELHGYIKAVPNGYCRVNL